MVDDFFEMSALVKRHVIEFSSAWVRSLVHAKAAHDLSIARVTTVEVTSAITRRQHSPGLNWYGDLNCARINSHGILEECEITAREMHIIQGR